MTRMGKLRLKTKGHGEQSWKTQLPGAGVCRQIPRESQTQTPPSSSQPPSCQNGQGSSPEPQGLWFFRRTEAYVEERTDGLALLYQQICFKYNCFSV